MATDYVKKIRTQTGDKQIDYTALANLPKSDKTLSKENEFADSKIVGDNVSTLKQGKAEAIVEAASGETITVEDSSDLKFEGLRIFGKSTQDGVPSPESPVPIVNVGDKGTIEVGVTGTNLFDVSKIEDTWNGSYGIKNNNGVLTIVANPTSSAVGTNKTLKELCPQLKNNETYVFNAVNSGKFNRIYLSEVKKTWGYHEPMVMTEEMLNSKVFLYISGNPNDSGTIRNIQVNRGETVLPYESYRTPQSLALATPNGLPGVKVDSDGNYTDKDGQQWVCDEIDLTRGKYVQRVENTVLNSSLGQTSVGTHGNGTCFLSVLVNIRPKIKASLFCERYKESTWTDRSGYIYAPTNYSIIVTDNRFTDLDTAKKIIDAEQAKLLYIMNTPIERDLAPEEIAAYKALHTNYPTTVIINDESAYMEVSYVADTKNYIVSKIETPLQKQITDLQNALISQRISGGGIKVTDSAKVPVVKLSMWGKTEQVKTTGAQLFDWNTVTHTGESDDKATISTLSTRLFSVKIRVESGIEYTLSVTARSISGKNIYLNRFILFNSEGAFIKRISLPKSEKYNITFEEGVAYVKLDFRTAELTETIEKELLDGTAMFNKGGAVLPYEPYSGGFSSPSPDWEQPIEVTDHPVTVTVKGGTEQQSITLVPPRPLTKWDKLEKVDGVWRWMYQHGDYTITGDENFLVGGESYIKGSSTNCFAQILKSPAESADAMMERLSVIDSVWSKVGAVGFCTNIDQLHMRLPNSMLGVSDNAAENEKIAAYKAYIKAEHDKGVPYHVVYKISTPEYIPLSQPVQDKLNALTMYAGTTEVTNDGGRNMELTYTVDTQSYVDTKIAEIGKAIL